MRLEKRLMRCMETSFTLLVIALFLGLASSHMAGKGLYSTTTHEHATPKHVARLDAQYPYIDVEILSASINGKRVDPDNPQILVEPGEELKGYIRFSVNNVNRPSVVTPVIGTVSWGREITHRDKGWFVCITDNAPIGLSYYTFRFDVRAPSKPGTYYIGVYAGWMYNCDEVAANDHPPIFGNGNDIWDFPKQGWEDLIKYGVLHSPQVLKVIQPYHWSGRAIRVVVGAQQAKALQAETKNNRSTWEAQSVNKNPGTTTITSIKQEIVTLTTTTTITRVVTNPGQVRTVTITKTFAINNVPVQTLALSALILLLGFLVAVVLSRK